MPARPAGSPSPGAQTDGRARPGLLAALRPHVDGLVVEQGTRRALFLPDVWAELPEPERFVEHLLRKARLSPRPWPAGLRAWRFTTQAWHRAPRGRAPAGRDE